MSCAGVRVRVCEVTKSRRILCLYILAKSRLARRSGVHRRIRLHSLKYLNTKTKHYPQCYRRKQRLDGSLPAKKKSFAVGNLGSLWAKNRWRPKEKKYSPFFLQKSLLLYLMLFAGSRNSKKLILKVAIQVKLRSTKKCFNDLTRKKDRGKKQLFWWIA